MAGTRTVTIALAALAALACIAVLLGAVALGAFLAGADRDGPGRGHGSGMMGGFGVYGPGMIGGPNPGAASAPGDAGFVPGTAASPRVIRILAGPGYLFSPSSISVARGETVTFVVTTMGPVEHEFMVGPADAVAADREGTPEIEGIGMMETGSLTYTFDGPGPYAYACHADDHYAEGMTGTITVVQ